MLGLGVIPYRRCCFRYREQGGISFWKSEFLDFAPIFAKIGQKSLNLMAIFLKRLNLVLDLSLNGIVQISVKVILGKGELAVRKVDSLFLGFWD
jgi:hypothetical protein